MAGLELYVWKECWLYTKATQLKNRSLQLKVFLLPHAGPKRWLKAGEHMVPANDLVNQWEIMLEMH